MSKDRKKPQEPMEAGAKRGPHGGPQGKPGLNMKVLSRLVKMLFQFYPVMVPAIIVCIVIAAVASAMPAIFQQQVLADIGEWYMTGDWAGAAKVIMPKVFLLLGIYVVAWIAILCYTQMMAFVTQGFLDKMRREMFDKMQNLPIRYFDTNKHGDIMSRYTNDIDTLRQLVSQALPVTLQCGILLISVFCIMMYYSVWLMVVVLLGVFVMFKVSTKIGGGSAKYFIRQQRSLGKAEGFIQEMMNGQKVVKVFNHEEQCSKDFKEINEALFEDAFRANAFANVLGPIIQNIGNVLYVCIAIVGGVLMLAKVPNPSVSALFAGSLGVLTIDVVVPFLNMAKQFSGNVNQISQQINHVVMALAGAERVFDLIDEEPEEDDGYVTLVNVEYDKEGNMKESDKHTGKWAWKHPHSDGTLTYTPLAGDVVMEEVDFAYEEGKTVLHNVSLYAKPGQKVAFVGATGAGKTTITNLINRFYDIEDGKIRYDGININKIKKQDLRRSLGLVLQDVNLFTGTVMENIRYGKLDATDEEVVKAAKLANADGFIRRLPEGYQTMLHGDGANLSQGQRQLLAIARAAIADPPVLILDEATSSIDTRTEKLVQQGMDALMHGRTNFVIAHRLSTVRNSDCIIVLEQGRIIERGTHEQLLELKGKYYQLYTGNAMAQ